MRRLVFTVLMHIIVLHSQPLLAMDAGEYGEFQQLMQTPINVLTDKAAKILETKHGCTELSASGFTKRTDPLIDNLFDANSSTEPVNDLPSFAHTNRTTHVAYLIAVKLPDILAAQPCYCSCEGKGHRNLLDCFLKDGKPKAFNDHASSCPACCSEAILIFLWSELGASHSEISGALRLMYDPSVSEPPPFTP